ncbi:MAG TPA: CRTAC1 family protein [Vicinamibacterales bacterium]|nr:CRTAC1 family protein [Vicinamibacterales bacterium]
MNRRAFLQRCGGGVAAAALAPALRAQPAPAPDFRFADVTGPAGIRFVHNSGAYGGKLLPETLGSGCAFLDYDADGWPDILFVNGMDWPGHKRQRSTLRLYRNNRNGTFADVTRAAGLDVELYGMGVAVGDYDNDGFPDVLVTCVGQNRLFRNTGNGTFVDVTRASGLHGREGFSTSAMWLDIDGDGLLDLFVCNYVRWSAEHDVFCSLDGRQKSYCTPEAYRGATCWLFRNRGNGTFEDITATSGVFDSSSKSLGVALVDYDADGRPDILVANDTQPNKLYRNLGKGTFRDVALEAGVALSEDGKARAGMGVDVGDFDNNGVPGIAITNFEGEMVGLYRAQKPGVFQDVATPAGVGGPSRRRLGFGCVFADLDLDGALDLVVANGHIDDTVRNISGGGHAQPALVFLNDGRGRFREVASSLGGGFAAPRVGRGLAVADFDRDGDLDVLMTTNNGPAVLFRNDQAAGHRSLRFQLVGTTSNRDAIGATVRIFHEGLAQMRTVRSGSSYLSQSELPLTFGVGRRDRIERAVITWPGGRTEEFRDLASARAYVCVEGKGIRSGS